MLIDVELLNVIRYEKKEDNSPRTMISYRLLDTNACQNKSDKKLKGYAVLNAYYDGHSVFEKIPSEFCGKAVKFTITKEVSPYDPLKEVSRVVKINDIDLV